MFAPRRLLMAGLAGVTGLVVSAAPAKADLVATFVSETPSQGVSVSLQSPSPGVSYNGSGGVMNFDVKGGTQAANFGTSFKGFCIELTQFISGGNTYTFSAVDPSTVTQVANKATVVNRLQELWGNYYSSTVGNAANANAFQLAVWETIYDSTFDLTSGNFRSASANATLSGWKRTADGTDLANWNKFYAGQQIVALTSPDTQDQITVANGTVYPPASGNPVPAPAGVWLGLIGVAALFGRSRVVGKSA
jgi:hypothetical protein